VIRRRRINLKLILILAVFLVAIIFVFEGAVKRMFPLKYEEYVYRYSYEYGLDPYLVFSIIKAESSFNPNATSPKSARGLMQVTDETALWIAEMMGIKDFKIESLYNPDTNIKFGCWFLNNLKGQFKDDDLIIASYNAGGGKVNSWLKDSRYSNTGETLDKIPYKETDIYVKRVKNYYTIYKMLYDKDE
jgi:soluble lytic murein transglycosylase